MLYHFHLNFRIYPFYLNYIKDIYLFPEFVFNNVGKIYSTRYHHHCFSYVSRELMWIDSRRIVNQNNNDKRPTIKGTQLITFPIYKWTKTGSVGHMSSTWSSLEGQQNTKLFPKPIDVFYRYGAQTKAIKYVVEQVLHMCSSIHWHIRTHAYTYTHTHTQAFKFGNKGKRVQKLPTLVLKALSAHG